MPYVSVHPSDGTINLHKRKKDGNTVISRKALEKLRTDFKIAVTEGYDLESILATMRPGKKIIGNRNA